jgi:phage regulator Rha-like protein
VVEATKRKATGKFACGFFSELKRHGQSQSSSEETRLKQAQTEHAAIKMTRKRKSHRYRCTCGFVNVNKNFKTQRKLIPDTDQGNAGRF